MGIMPRRRTLVYVQIALVFLGGLYLLLKHDGILPPRAADSLASFGQKNADVAAGAQQGGGGEVKVGESHSRPTSPESTAITVTTTTSDATTATTTASTTTTTATTTTTTAPDPTTTTTTAAASDQGSNDKPAQDGKGAQGGEGDHAPAETSSSAPKSDAKSGKDDLRRKAQSLLPAILNPDDKTVDRMACPAINETRYGYLRASATQPRYFIALNLRQCVDLLPRLLGSVLEAIRFLGPQNCALSVVEGNSDDGTREVLELLEIEARHLGVRFYLVSSALNPSTSDRIAKLAALRALAVEPITGPVKIGPDEGAPEPWEKPIRDRLPPNRLELAEDAVVIFLNDVAACAEDILELAHQRVFLGAEMTCAMDWTHIEDNPYFYDIWISRTIHGDLFFDIPPDGSWSRAQNLFANEPVAHSRLAAGRPFQVFSCWNGAVAFTAAPLIPHDGVRFRSPRPGECFQGEVQLFCKDLWARGRGRLAVVPSVNLEYSDAMGRVIKNSKGYVTDFVAREAFEDAEEAAKDGAVDVVGKKRPGPRIDEWRGPPAMVKCMPSFNRQSWMLWNESL